MLPQSKSVKFFPALMQVKGRVTIPEPIREQLKLIEGDRLVFVEVKNGVLLQHADTFINSAPSLIGRELKKQGLSLDQMIKHSRKIRDELLKEEYGLEDESN